MHRSAPPLCLNPGIQNGAKHRHTSDGKAQRILYLYTYINIYIYIYTHVCIQYHAELSGNNFGLEFKGKQDKRVCTNHKNIN